MQVIVSNLRLEKAGEGTDKVVPVRLVVNQLELDREGQQILPEAFDEETVNYFLSNGIIDWFHKTATSKDPTVQAESTLGKPTKFAWEVINGKKLPVIYANLTKSNSIVSNHILPHLEADNNVFAASIGGGAKVVQVVTDPQLGKIEKIPKILWNHLAIAPAPYTMSPGCSVQIAKAKAGITEAHGELVVYFDSFDSFRDGRGILTDEPAMRKALEVSAETDSAKLQGADALREQSLEGAKVDINSLLRHLILAIQFGEILPTLQGVKTFCLNSGVQQDKIDETASRLVNIIKKAIAT